MTVLSDGTISRLVSNGELGIYPFDPHHLTPAGYDLTLDDDITLEPMGTDQCRALASSTERIVVPRYLVGDLFGRSSVARLFVMGHVVSGPLEPGWRGQVTFEMVNLDMEWHRFLKGDRIAQVRFLWLDKPAMVPYRGRYQDQQGPTSSRFRHGDD